MTFNCFISRPQEHQAPPLSFDFLFSNLRQWVESLGADKCFNYKSPTFRSDLASATSDGDVDVYFDNVGGEILDFVLTRMARNGRIAACGSISTYNTSADRTTGLKNWFEVISQRLQIKGFIVSDMRNQWPEAVADMTSAAGEGKLKIGEDSEDVVKTSFEDIPKTWVKLFEGANRGKLVTDLRE